MRRDSACKRPGCPSQQLEPCSSLWPGALSPPRLTLPWLPAPRSRGLRSCLAQVLQGVYFPQAPPRDRLLLPPSGPALVGAAGGLSGTPGQRGACVARRREGRQVHLSACLLGLHPGHLRVHDRCVATSRSRRGSQAARAQPAWPGPRHRVLPGQHPSCPVLRGPGARDEQSVGGAGTWGLMAHAMLVGCRGDDRQPFPAPGLRLVVSRSLNSRAHTAECRRTFPARRPTSFPLRGTSKHAACSSLPLFLGSVCLSGCPRGARWRWAQLWAYEVGGGGRSRGPCRPPKPSSPSVCLLECLLWRPMF